jgi:type VI secretion system protein
MASFLTRLRHPNDAQAGSGPGGSGLRDDVLQHLRAMCGTRRGSMRTRPDYGIPDVSEMVHAFPTAIAELASALEHTITTYEPRLRDVRIRHVPNDSSELMVRFEISATLVGPGRPVPVRYETRMDASREITVA